MDKQKESLREDIQVGVPENVAHRVHVRSDLEWNGEDPFNLFQLSDKLGEGSFGSVWKVITKGHQGQGRETALAIKQIVVNEETDIEDIENEIKILKQCKSDHIVTYYGVFRAGTILWILMDYCGLGSVADIMEINDKPFGEKSAAWVMRSALHGLAYLHGLGIVHRDVKGGNILVTELGEIKLADFGVSEQLEKTLGEVAGTPLWMAPEVAKRGEKYNHKADIWSLGITLIELIDRVPPLSEFNAYRVMLAIQHNEPPTVKAKHASSNLLDFLSKCLLKDYHVRWDTGPLLKHPFVLNAKQSVMKKIVDLTMKNKAVYKFRKTPYIDHTPSPGPSPNPSPRPDNPSGSDNHYTIPLPTESTDSLDSVSYVDLEKSANPTSQSIVMHSSVPTLPDVQPKEPSSAHKLPWARSNYVPVEESDSMEPASIVQVVRVGDHSSKSAKKPQDDIKSAYRYSEMAKEKKLATDLDLVTPRATPRTTPRANENRPLITPSTKKDHSSCCECCGSCTIL